MVIVQPLLFTGIEVPFRYVIVLMVQRLVLVKVLCVSTNILEPQANPKKIGQKNYFYIASMGETGLSHDIFLIMPIRVVEFSNVGYKIKKIFA